jgi:hypothetical protein
MRNPTPTRPPRAPDKLNGWVIGVMIETPEMPGAQRHFFAVDRADRAEAEWKAVDAASLIGAVATSPVKGLEPVHAVSELTAAAMRNLALGVGKVKLLGTRWPRRWVSAGAV